MLPGSFSSFFNATRYSKVIAWRLRYKTAITAAKESAPKPTVLESADCIQKILNSPFFEPTPKFEDDDPSGLVKGSEIKMTPADTGFSHADQGKLIGLTGNEAVIECLSKEGQKEMHVHYPRWNFTFEAVGEGQPREVDKQKQAQSEKQTQQQSSTHKEGANGVKADENGKTQSKYSDHATCRISPLTTKQSRNAAVPSSV